MAARWDCVMLEIEHFIIIFTQSEWDRMGRPPGLLGGLITETWRGILSPLDRINSINLPSLWLLLREIGEISHWSRNDMVQLHIGICCTAGMKAIANWRLRSGQFHYSLHWNSLLSFNGSLFARQIQITSKSYKRKIHKHSMQQLKYTKQQFWAVNSTIWIPELFFFCRIHHRNWSTHSESINTNDE